ncbi:MAG: hypothetical protein IKW57_04350 [Alphaproteobacteria bacterium]|nr:hypothetical protein [Alphaproteobacteria bacterium]
MLTKIDLCSMALLKLGEQPIQSLTDDSAAAKLSRTLFDVITDSLISLHPWRFATAQLELVRNTDGDFLIPSDVLRVLRSDGDIIGNRIISDLDSVSAVVLRRVSPEQFPSYFISLAVTRLAMEFCIPLLGDQTVFRMLAALYETELQTAKYLDSTTSAPSCLTDFSLISSRF